jgi:hypothetical protein
VLGDLERAKRQDLPREIIDIAHHHLVDPWRGKGLEFRQCQSFETAHVRASLKDRTSAPLPSFYFLSPFPDHPGRNYAIE